MSVLRKVAVAAVSDHADDYRCGWCGTTEQFTCRCWELEAAKYRHEAAEATR